jgi:hypothetical protein
LINVKADKDSHVNGRRLVFYWDASTPANGSPIGGVVVDGQTYAVGDSYWPYLGSNYDHGGNGGMFIDPANRFTPNNPAFPDGATITPDYRLAGTVHPAGSQARLPAGYWVPVQMTIGAPFLKGPYYLRVQSSGPRLLNVDPLYRSSDGGQPWLRVYADSFNKSNGQLTPSTSTAPHMSVSHGRFDQTGTMTSILVFDRLPTSSDLSLELESTPDGVDVYSPATGQW